MGLRSLTAQESGEVSPWWVLVRPTGRLRRVSSPLLRDPLRASETGQSAPHRPDQPIGRCSEPSSTRPGATEYPHPRGPWRRERGGEEEELRAFPPETVFPEKQLNHR